MEAKGISQAVIGRLPRYFRYLGELKDEGVERISSQELSGLMKVTASQIRQDFNNFGGFGQQGYGYNVKFLHDEIGKILGLNQRHNIIVVGAGNLGQALANYVKFEKLGFVIIALFDVNPALKGKKLVDSGVHAIWNFAHVDLELTDKDVVVENVHLSDSLMQLSYNIVKNQSAKEK